MSPQVAAGATYRWLHFDLNDPALEGWAHMNLPAVAARSLLAPKTRPRIDLDDAGGMVVTLRGINLNAGAEQADMVSLRIWATETLLVSVRRERVFAMEDMRDQIIAGDAPPTAFRMVARITESLVERVEKVTLELEDVADLMEEEVYESGRTPLRALSPLRRKVIKLRRHIGPLSSALHDLSHQHSPLIKGGMKNRLRDTASRAARAMDELSEVQDRLSAMADHLDMTQATRLERNGYRLSIAAAIFLPLGFVTGLFGVNVGGMPGGDSPYAFAILTAAMVVIGALIWVTFRLFRWF
jgi:zinc transporter